MGVDLAILEKESRGAYGQLVEKSILEIKGRLVVNLQLVYF